MLYHNFTGPVMSHLILNVKNKTLLYIIFSKLFILDNQPNEFSYKILHVADYIWGKWIQIYTSNWIISYHIVSLFKYAKLPVSCCTPISKRYDLNLSYLGLFVSSWVSMISSSRSMTIHYYSLFAFFVSLDVWRLMLASTLLSTFPYWKYTTFLF